MHGENKLLRYTGATKQLHRRPPADHCGGAELGWAIRASIKLFFNALQLQNLIGNTAWLNKTSELRLPADERRLATFKTKTATLSRARFLAFTATTCGGAAAGTITTPHPDTAEARSRCWTQGMEHSCEAA